MKQIRKATLQDVAYKVGVSTATVSRCLNQPDKVKPEVRERVHKAIAELGYVPDGAARALASRRTKTIGAVVPTIDNAIFSEAIQYLQRGLAQAGYTLLLAQSQYSLEAELKEVQSLLSRGVDGLVLVGEEHDPALAEAIKVQNIPYVNLWVYNAYSKYSCIGLDNIGAGCRLAQHLIDLGHERIGCITGILKHNDRASQRLQGITACLGKQDIILDKQHIIESRYSGEQGRLAMHCLMERFPDITGVICGNDVLALGVLCAANELGLHVPNDISVTGFDNLEICSVLRPALTTIHVPSRRMGQQAAEYLIREIAQPSGSIERIEIPSDLIIRETTGKKC